jgi:hypothetical protein
MKMIRKIRKNFIQPISRGFILSQSGSSTQPHNQVTLPFSPTRKTVVDHCWFRGGWFDPLTIAWETIRKGELKN